MKVKEMERQESTRNIFLLIQNVVAEYRGCPWKKLNENKLITKIHDATGKFLSREIPKDDPLTEITPAIDSSTTIISKPFRELNTTSAIAAISNDDEEPEIIEESKKPSIDISDLYDDDDED